MVELFFRNKVAEYWYNRWNIYHCYSVAEHNNYERLNNSNVPINIPINEKNILVDDRLDMKSMNSPGICIYESVRPYENHILLNLEAWFTFNEVKRIAYIEMESVIPPVEVKKLFVDKEYGNNGIATSMMKRLLEWAELRKIKEIRLRSVSDGRISQEKLDEFYCNLGFEKYKAGVMIWKG